jgi:hypothetical protein
VDLRVGPVGVVDMADLRVGPVGMVDMADLRAGMVDMVDIVAGMVGMVDITEGGIEDIVGGMVDIVGGTMVDGGILGLGQLRSCQLTTRPIGGVVILTTMLMGIIMLQ